MERILNPFHQIIYVTLLIPMHPHKDRELFFRGNHQEAAGHLLKLTSILVALN